MLLLYIYIYREHNLKFIRKFNIELLLFALKSDLYELLIICRINSRLNKQIFKHC